MSQKKTQGHRDIHGVVLSSTWNTQSVLVISLESRMRRKHNNVTLLHYCITSPAFGSNFGQPSAFSDERFVSTRLTTVRFTLTQAVRIFRKHFIFSACVTDDTNFNFRSPLLQHNSNIIINSCGWQLLRWVKGMYQTKLSQANHAPFNCHNTVLSLRKKPTLDQISCKLINSCAVDKLLIHTELIIRKQWYFLVFADRSEV